jgi:hypothetical protein
MLVVAGDQPTQERRELWDSTIKRSFEKDDGGRRVADLFNQMKSIETGNGERHAVYLADDKQVIRIVKKVIRGLSHYHEIMTAVPEELVWADILRYQVPQDIAEGMHYCHRDPNIVEYKYQEVNVDEIGSVWVVTFFKAMSFVGIIHPASALATSASWAPVMDSSTLSKSSKRSL